MDRWLVLAASLVFLPGCTGVAAVVEETAAADAPPMDAFYRVLGDRRSENDPGRWILQTSVRVLQHPATRQSITLLAMCHTASPEFYRGLEPYLDEADIVLAEGIEGDQASEWAKDVESAPEWGQWVLQYHVTRAKALGHELQDDWETRIADRRWVYADLPKDEMIAEIRRFPVTPEAWALVAEPRTAEERAAVRGRAARSMLATRAYDPAKGAHSSFHRRREEFMWQAIRDACRAGKRRIVFMAGAAHMWFLEPRVRNELGFRHRSTAWHDIGIIEAADAALGQEEDP